MWAVNIFCFVFSAQKVIGRKCVFSYVDVLSLPTNSENKNIQKTKKQTKKLNELSELVNAESNRNEMKNNTNSLTQTSK